MKEIKTTPQGYYYADVTGSECLRWGGLGLCDSCNEPILDNGKLVWVLNSCYCDKCYNSWQTRAVADEFDLYNQKDCAEEWFKLYLGENITMPEK